MFCYIRTSINGRGYYEFISPRHAARLVLNERMAGRTIYHATTGAGCTRVYTTAGECDTELLLRKVPLALQVPAVNPYRIWL